MATSFWRSFAVGVSHRLLGTPYTPEKLRGTLTLPWEATVSAASGLAAHLTMDSARRELVYQSNSTLVTTPLGDIINAANVVPSPDMLISLVYSSDFPTAKIQKLLRYHGIDWSHDPPNGTDITRQAWEIIIDRMRPTLGADQAATYYHSGLIDRDAFDRQLLRKGVVDEADRDTIAADMAPLPLGTLVGLFHTGQLDPPDFRAQVNLHGLARNEFAPLLWTGDAPYGADTAQSLLNRGAISQDRYISQLKADGVVSPLAQQQYLASTAVVPSLGAIMDADARMLQDDEIATRYGLDNGLTAFGSRWLGAAGIRGTTGGWNEDGTERQGRAWDTMLWRQHWSVLTVAQASMAHAMFQGQGLEDARQDDPLLPAFELRDLQYSMVASGVAPNQQGWAYSLTFARMQKGDIQQSYQFYLMDDTEALDRLHRLNFAKVDARKLVRLWKRQRDWGKRNPLGAYVRRIPMMLLKEILAGFQDGFMDEAEAKQRIELLGVTGQSLDDLINLQKSTKLRSWLRERLKQLRREYLNGSMTDAEVLAAMARMRVDSGAAGNYLLQWTGLRTEERRIASTGQLLRWVAEGMVPAPIALARLLALGWVRPDAILAVAEAQSKLTLAQTRAATAAGRSRAATARALAQAAAQQQRLLRQTQAALKRASPLSALKKWLALGIVSEAWVISRMQAMGYAANIIADYLREWAAEAANASTKKAAKGAAGSGPPTTPTSGP